VDNPLVKAKIGQNSKWINNLIMHYTYENRLENYKKDIHQLWNQISGGAPASNGLAIASPEKILGKQ
jgi:hypothetical protein